MTEMADICILGTGGTLPKPERHLASVLLRHQGHSVLFDCGEGTQIAIKKAGLNFKPIDVICVSHFHADHISGLAGLLLTMGNEGREAPVTIITPPGGAHVIKALTVIAPDIPFQLLIKEYDGDPSFSVKITDDALLHVEEAAHSVPCISFSVKIRRNGRFDVEKAKSNEVPQALWNVLRRDGIARVDGRVYKASDVMGEERKGLKLTYITDSRPSERLFKFAENSDILICEGMFGDPEKLARAELTGHMMFSEAATLARDSASERLILTHFSPSLPDPEEYLSYATEIFPNTAIAEDGMTLKFDFEPRE